MPTDPPPLLEARGLCRTLRAPDGSEKPVFSGINFALEKAGDVLFIRGPSGTGKTLLLRAVALLDPAQRGALRLRGASPDDVGSAPRWRARVTYVHQARVDYPGTPLEFFEAARGLAAREGRPCGDVAAVASEMGLDAAAVLNQKWASLSGGQAQRVSLAIAVALRPDVLLLDEPTSACDGRSAKLVERALKRSGAALLWVTHDDAQPARVGGRALALPSGEVEAVEAAAEASAAGGSSDDDGGAGGGGSSSAAADVEVAIGA